MPNNLAQSLPRSAYWDSDFFEREQDAIFRGQWIYAGRGDQLESVGAYRVLEIAGESIILIRTENGLAAHLNFCRHRGSRLLSDQGTVRGAIRCPYHAWAYALDGRLIASPFIARDDVPERARRLHGVGVAEWGGFVFLHLAFDEAERAGATLAAQLGIVPQRVARYPLAELRTACSLHYDVAANWKVILENYNECYHCAGVHPELCRIVPAFKEAGGRDLDWDRGIEHRDGAWTFTLSGTSDRAPFATLDDEERVRHKGELIYPNLMLSLAADHVASFALVPRGPAQTTIVCDLLFHPDETSKPSFDPRDASEFWDLVNHQDWHICESVQAGMKSKAFDYGYYAPMEDASLDIREYVNQSLSLSRPSTTRPSTSSGRSAQDDTY
ncbi:MAG: aromatic ring-hydroxylating dioxygenase subunit alpha [Candidatus Eremiobacteraeota bacterium]|nr:aromatic ring-hydroxylating dioxygenase subunit alpha [Candidatus Eremiobacteraeota bacterium]